MPRFRSEICGTALGADSTWSLMSFVQPGCWRQLLNSLAPLAYS